MTEGSEASVSYISLHEPRTVHPVGERYRGAAPPGVLADVAPTVLSMLGIPKPGEMDRDSLIIT